jgi:hypothetical protein
MSPFSTAQRICRNHFPQFALWATNIPPSSMAENITIVKVPFINLVFFFEKNEVGLFEGFKFPSKDGIYQYEPYRGFGHLEMWKTIKERALLIVFISKKTKKCCLGSRMPANTGS